MNHSTKEKCMNFSIRVVNLYKYLCDEKHEYVLAKQVLRSGTSIGANLAEAESASSRNDFLSKVYISLKECNETLYWLELLYRTDYISKSQYESLYKDGEELKKILTATTKTLSTNK